MALLSRRAAQAGLLAATIFALVLAVLRIASATSFGNPPLMLTSGLEEEALFGIWRVKGGEVPYLDVRDIPYAHSYFNWLFYYAFAGAVQVFQWVLGAGDSWIPLAAHLATLTAGVVGAVAFAISLRDADCRTRGGCWHVPLLAGALAFFGPLTGFWVFTARPDVPALCLDICAFAAAIRYFDRGGNRHLWSAVAFALLAWSFKQPSIIVIGSLLAALALAGQWRNALLACAAALAWFSLPFVAFGDAYVVNAYIASTAGSYLADLGAHNLALAALKSPAILLAPVAILMALARERRLLEQPALRFAAIAFLSSVAFSVGTGAKEGASQNYYFLPGCLALWWLVRLRFGPGTPAVEVRRLPAGVFLAAMLAQGVGAAAVLAGLAGRLDVSGGGDDFAHLQQSLPAMEAPVLVLERAGNLPWIQRRAPHLVFGHLYDAPAIRSLGYRHGGLEGLVESGYIRTVVIPRNAVTDLRVGLPAGMSMKGQDERYVYWSR